MTSLLIVVFKNWNCCHSIYKVSSEEEKEEEVEEEEGEEEEEEEDLIVTITVTG